MNEDRSCYLFIPFHAVTVLQLAATHDFWVCVSGETQLIITASLSFLWRLESSNSSHRGFLL